MFSFFSKKNNWYINRAKNYRKSDDLLYSWLQELYDVICKYERIYIYGTDSNSFKVYDYLKTYGIKSEQLFFIENNPDKRINLNAVSIKEIDNFSHNICVLLISTLLEETLRQLKKANIAKNQIFIYKKRNSLLGHKIFNYFLYEIKYLKNTLDALLVYSKLLEIYKHKRIYLCPYPGTGDILFTGDIFHLIIEKDNLKENEYVVLIGSNSCKSILEHFGINNVEVIPQKNIDLLKYICSIFSSDITNITYLGFWGLYYQKIARLCYTSKLSFRDFLHSLFLGSYKNVDNLKTIQFKKHSVSFNELLGESVNIKNVIILAPVAGIEFNDGISIEFWEELAAFLLNLGYIVFTNTNGKDFPVIRNTKKIFLNYDDFFYTLNECKALIGLRSGLFDIMNSVNCKKIVFYPPRYSDNLLNFFSLKKNYINISNCLELKLNVENKELFKSIFENLSHE
ncbi:hypothetical protein [Succinivibrio dextrinosolvens]|uniref:hypothetical protein n=1 Tax=Succinivibrio dextrinosolvens TaxID=83771 RepID=UPI0019239F3A|nr:hypothetical protein [Succinivibrio dextrinosolvens]